jgi:2-polyprenyl-3-methyl-5-hydroxy-6-metoxy-1,4-benzoquinol methylase
MRTIDRNTFNDKYEELILNSKFFEEDDYYVRQRPRYFNTLKLLLEKIDSSGDLSRLQVLEIGGGQIALLLNALFGCKAVVADVSDKYKESLPKQDCEFRVCDLLYDDLPDRNHFDVVIMCEVVEHMPVPPYKILSKIRTWMKPGGLLFMTTPNLYRLRNVVRLMLGMRVFDHFFIPERGQSIGHPFEYSAEHLSWQIAQGGFIEIEAAYKQLSLSGATLRAKLARLLLAPLLLRSKFRDKLVVTARAA